MSKADKPSRQYVQKKSPQELACREGHQLLLAAVRIILPPERDSVFQTHYLAGTGNWVSNAAQQVRFLLRELLSRSRRATLTVLKQTGRQMGIPLRTDAPAPST